MIIIADKRIPAPVKENLEIQGKVIYLLSSGITYPAISGHPDIFFCKTDNFLVYAPNTPADIVGCLEDAGISLKKANYPIGNKYPQTASLNAVITAKFFIHNQQYTDPLLKELCSHLEPVQVKQAYTRCNVIPIDPDRFITSDRGIKKALEKKGSEVLYVDPTGIRLPGHNHGFIGGCCGITDHDIYFTGRLDTIKDGNMIIDFLRDYTIHELYPGPLHDGGSLILLSK